MPPMDLMTVYGRSLPDIKYALDTLAELYGEDWTPQKIEQRKLAIREFERIVLLGKDSD